MSYHVNPIAAVLPPLGPRSVGDLPHLQAPLPRQPRAAAPVAPTPSRWLLWGGLAAAAGVVYYAWR